MAAPTLADLKAYLGTTHSWTDAQLTAALAAESAAQARRCRIPDPAVAWPADLAEALFRRVDHNLAVRALPLGIAPSMTDSAVATDRVGGLDAEVRRLEAPYRKLVMG